MHEVFRTFGIPKRMDKWRSTIRMMHVCQKGNQVLRQKVNIYTKISIYNFMFFMYLKYPWLLRFFANISFISMILNLNGFYSIFTKKRNSHGHA